LLAVTKIAFLLFTIEFSALFEKTLSPKKLPKALEINHLKISKIFNKKSLFAILKILTLHQNIKSINY
jgi:hypothetical protein